MVAEVSACTSEDSHIAFCDALLKITKLPSTIFASPAYSRGRTADAQSKKCQVGHGGRAGGVSAASFGSRFFTHAHFEEETRALCKVLHLFTLSHPHLSILIPLCILRSSSTPHLSPDVLISLSLSF